MRRADRVEDLAGQARRRLRQRGRRGGEGGPVAHRPLPLPLLEEREVRGERVVVERRLDLKDLDPRLGDEAAHAPVGRMELGAVLVHEGLRVPHGLRVVVVAQAAVAGQAGGHALVPAVHGDEVDVHVDQEVRRGGPLVDLHLLALVGLADVEEVAGVLGVVLGQEAVGREGVVDAVAQRVAELVLGHAAVQGQGGDQDDVVHARRRGHLEHGLDDHLAHVGRLHLRQRERDVVEADRQLHPRAQQRGQRVTIAGGVEERVANGPVRVFERLHRLGRVDHTAALGQRLEHEALAVPEQGGWRGLVHLEDEAGSAAHRVCPFRTSNAIFTAPRRPAAPAWATASSKRVRG